MTRIERRANKAEMEIRGVAQMATVELLNGVSSHLRHPAGEQSDSYEKSTCAICAVVMLKFLV
jgi:hypothetical protein